MQCRPIGIVTVLVSLAIAPPAQADEAASKEIDLLQPAAKGGLEAWESFSQDENASLADTWRLEDGVLVCTGKPLGYLYTKKSYTDFVLKLQYRVPKEAGPHKGGILFRMTGKHRIWPKSLEAQINHPDAGDFWGLDGFALDGPADRKKQMMHKQFGLLTNLKKTEAAAKELGEWNDYEIRAEGGTVVLSINGREVNRATGCDVVAGPILLTAEGNEIHFRNVKLTPKK